MRRFPAILQRDVLRDAAAFGRPASPEHYAFITCAVRPNDVRRIDV